jgi:VWFA-related protein
MLRAHTLVCWVTLLVLLLSAWAEHAVAQDCPACADANAAVLIPNVVEALSSPFRTPTVNREPWTIYKRVDEVTVFFAVRKGHRYVDDLTAAELKVEDDRRRVAKLSSFGRQTDLPLRLGLLVDTSDSVRYRFNFEKRVSSEFLYKIVRSKMDRAFVMGFSTESKLAADYTDDGQQLSVGVSALGSGGDTALFDAVVQVCEKLASAEADSTITRVLVLFSDGEDNASKKTLGKAIEVAQRSDVTIYPISTNDSGLAQPGDSVLKRLGIETGGIMFRPNTGRAMVDAFARIDSEMRSRYAISYHPSDLEADGRYRGIEITAERSHKRLRVDARKGYYAPMAPSSF